MVHVESSPVRDLLALVDRPEVISFAGGLPAPEFFDLDGLRAAFHQALCEPVGRRNLQYAPTEGNPELRGLVASRLSARGVVTSGEDLLITTGSQQGLTLVTAALLEPGAVVAVEEPTYLAALQCFRMAGARVVPVAGDEDGMIPSALEEVIRAEKPSLVYLVPTFANPTGRTLSGERRGVIAGLAARYGVWVVEDDPYGELRYRGEPLPALAVGAPEHVVHLGSFSKVGAPGLRIGWVRAPSALLRTLVIVKQAADLHTSTVDQAAAAVYLGTADLDARVGVLRDAYRVRRDVMVGALGSVAPEGTTWTDPDGGMFVWVRLPGEVDAGELLVAALENDVAFVPGAAFYAGEPDRSTLRLSFASNGPGAIEAGMERLGVVLRG